MLHHKIFCFCIALCLFLYTKAQEEYDLVFDGNASNGSSWIYIDQNSDLIFFATRSSANDRELWKSDGTQSGTGMIKDIHPSSNGIPTTPIGVVVGEMLYFAGNGGTSTGQELWKSDGTEAGTVLIKDIYAGVNFGFDSEYIVEFDGGVAFTGQDEDGEELWISDGTEEGTVQVKDIKAGSTGSLVRYIANANGTLYFIAADASEFGLWKSDGTNGGTTKLSDLGADANPEHVTFHQGNILFYNFTSSDPTMDEFWISDGTVEGTEKLTDILTSGPINDPMVAAGNNLFFRAADDDVGIELYKSDGTAGGTGFVKDLDVGAGDSFPENFIEYLGEIYFVAETDLWKSDGTEGGTTIVVPDVNSRTEILSDGSNLYYRIGNNLGIYNPTDGASVITTAPDFYVHDLKTIFKEELYFIGSDDVEDEYDLWKYNLTSKVDQTITFDELSNVTFGDSDFNLTASSTSDLSVTFSSSDDGVAEVNGNTVTIIGAGTCDITASQSGDGEYNAAPNVVRTLTVDKASQSITFDALAVKELGDNTFNLSATASSSLDVTFASSNAAIATVTSEGTVTIAGVGTTTITASQSGNANYLAATDVEQTLTIVDALGLEDDTNFRIYPNPVTDELTIEFLNQALSGTIELMDATGKVILSRNINATRLSIPMAELQSGIYYLLHAETGRTFKVLKASR